MHIFKKIRVLVVEDSMLFRLTLKKLFENDDTIEVVDTASDVYEARDKILELRPDAITLDIEMPKMNGMQFLKKLIPQYPIPCIVITSLPVSQEDVINVGAIGLVKKLKSGSPEAIAAFKAELKTKLITSSVTAISGAVKAKERVTEITAPVKKAQEENTSAVPLTAMTALNSLAAKRNSKLVVALGASTGGTDALEKVIKEFPEDFYPVLVVQHMPPVFTKMYAERLNRTCRMNIKEAQDGDRVTRGMCIIAAGEHHMELRKDSGGYYVHCYEGEKVSGHCPSVDVMFRSVAEIAKENVVAALLTGMGSDGADGLLKLRTAGAYTIGQNQESCVVYGMPMVAHNIGACCEQAHLNDIGELICRKAASLG